MTNDILLLIIGTLCGVSGHVLGLGGGILVVPILATGLQIPIHQAIGASLVTIMATSTFTSIYKVKQGQVAFKLANVIESLALTATLLGAYLSLQLEAEALKNIFAFIVSCIAIGMIAAPYLKKGRPSQQKTSRPSSHWDGTYWDEEHEAWQTYQLRNFPALALALCGASFLAGILGIGGSIIMVPALTALGGLPIRIATATSSYMLGLTSSGAALVFWLSGYTQLSHVIPLVLGVLFGAWMSRRYFTKLKSATIRSTFIVVLIIIGVRMWMH